MICNEHYLFTLLRHSIYIDEEARLADQEMDPETTLWIFARSAALVVELLKEPKCNRRNLLNKNKKDSIIHFPVPTFLLTCQEE